MKKKIIIIGLVFIMLITALLNLTGCETKSEVEEKKEESTKQTAQQPTEQVVEQPTPVVDETLVKINGLEFHLNKETSFKDIKYTIVEDFKEADHDRYIQYNYYQEDKTNLLFFRIFYYSGKGNDAAIKDLGLDNNITLTDGKTDNIEYKYYAEPRADGGTKHFYFINKNGNTYAINFVSKYDIKDFEDKVIKSIKF